VRHRLPVVCVVANNGIWGLEKHPMKGVYGHDVAADLRPGSRYDLAMRALGCRGKFVENSDEIAPALKRALDSGEPYLIHVVADPKVGYPRSSMLF
jgi:acetolactate synthase I/II/III large subunit